MGRLKQSGCWLRPSPSFKAIREIYVIESLIQDLSHIDENIEKLWIEESNRRLELYNNGKLD